LYHIPVADEKLLSSAAAWPLHGSMAGCTAARRQPSPGPPVRYPYMRIYAKSYAKTRKNRQKAQINTKIKLYISDSHVIINNTLY
jgi:hypothetical protein